VAVNGGSVGHVQYVKLVDGTGNGTEGVPGNAANGLDVDVTRVQGTVTVGDGGGLLSVDDGGGSLTVDGSVSITGTVTADTELTTADLDTGAGTDTRGVVGLVLAASGGGLLVGATNPMPVSDNAGSLTVDNPILSVVGGGTEAAAQRVTLASDSTGVLTVKQATGSNLHAVLDSGTLTTITNVVHVDDNAGSLTVDAPVGTPVFTRLSDGTAALTTTGGRLSVDASGVAVPVTDNAGSLTIDSPGVPTALGQSTMANSMRVVIASDQTAVPASQSGTWNIGTVTTLTGITNVVHVDDNAASLTIDSPGVPTALGQSTMANSMRVVLASDQSAVPVSQSGTWNVGTITNVVHVDDNAGSLTVDSPQLPAALGQGTMAQGMKVALASDQTTIPVTVANLATDAAATEPSVGLIGGWDGYAVRSATVQRVDGQNRLMVFDPKTRTEMAEILLVLQDIRNLLMTGDTTIVIPSTTQSY